MTCEKSPKWSFWRIFLCNLLWFFLEYLQTTAVFAESLIAHDLDHSAGDQNPQIEGLHEGKAVKLYKWCCTFLLHPEFPGSLS